MKKSMITVIHDGILLTDEELGALSKEYDCHVFTDVKEGLEYVLKNPDNVVITGWYLDNRYQYRADDLYNAIRKSSSSIPMIIISPGFVFFDYPSTTMIRWINDSHLTWMREDNVSISSLINMINHIKVKAK